MLLFLHGEPSGWAAGNRNALSFQGLVKGLEARMQRKYIFIHLSVPICPLSLFPALSYLSVVLPSLHFLKRLRSHPGLLDRHFTREVMSSSRGVRLDLSWPSLILPSHRFFVRLLLSFFFPSLTIPSFLNLIILQRSESWRVTEMYERSCNCCFLFIMSKWVTVYFPKKIHCNSLVFPATSQ